VKIAQNYLLWQKQCWLLYRQRC